MAAKRVTPFVRRSLRRRLRAMAEAKAERTSGTERMSVALILRPGTGGFRGADGVKAAKLFVEQDHIGKRLNSARVKLPGRSLKGLSNKSRRGMIIT